MEKRIVNSTGAKSNRLILPFLLGAAILFCLPLQGAAQTGATADRQTNQTATESWTGGYFFDDSARTPQRRRQTDVAPHFNYDIAVEERADSRFVASFTAQGTQLFDAYECTVEWTDERADFYFEKNADPNFPNVKKFKRGDFLFNL